jgi:hypothetical protein
LKKQPHLKKQQLTQENYVRGHSIQGDTWLVRKMFFSGDSRSRGMFVAEHFVSHKTSNIYNRTRRLLKLPSVCWRKPTVLLLVQPCWYVMGTVTYCNMSSNE